MSKKYQIFLTCGFVATAANVFAETNYADLQKQVIASDAVLNSYSSPSKLMKSIKSLLVD